MHESYILASGQHFRLPTSINKTLYSDANLKPVHRELYIRLLMKLEAYNSANTFCQNYYPVSIEKIRAWFGQSAKTIREHIHVLSEHGYLQEEGIIKLNKNRPILIGVMFLTLNFSPIENNEQTENLPSTTMVEKKVSKPSHIELMNKAPRKKIRQNQP
ncbi:MAG: helix-turn-helix domain-containing protein [gamma proteobacterium symbiont of Lucinoma myriamae]|nr:helix-turn-helix domain-containing protein [gamma proteobacterium symbiont of Lucinoma myriamae]